jgi:hypothetical protein
MQMISRRYDASKLRSPKLEDYIDVYEDQIKGWRLTYAKQMHADEHAGFAALNIAFSYFEGHAIAYKGQDSNGHSKRFFSDAFLSVFPELNEYDGMNESLLDDTISAIYQDGRCGFFHAGLTRRRFLLEDGDPIIRIGADPQTEKQAVQIFVDRRKFVDRVCEQFDRYIARLRNPSETRLRKNFEVAIEAALWA